MNHTSQLLDQIKKTASSAKKRIVFPEYGEARTVAAVQELTQTGICEPVILSKSSTPDFAIQFWELPSADDWYQKAIKQLQQKLMVNRGLDNVTAKQQAINLVDENPLWLGTGLVACGFADAGVAGASNSTADVLRACLNTIGTKDQGGILSSVFLMDHPYRVMTYGDCAVIPNPNSEQLAQIAIDAATTHSLLTGEAAKLALLSFSTKGSAKHASLDKVLQCLEILRRDAPHLEVDGELQADAALIPEIGDSKAPDSSVAGMANVLIFPDLNSGNIAYKLTERLGGAIAVGPILQGLKQPWIDLSRGCSVEDIVNAAAIVSLQAD